MRRRVWQGAWMAAALLSPTVALAQQGVAWQSDLPTAQQMAAQSNRLVLVQFGAPWCEACQRMERETLADPRVGGALSTDYVPVRLNVDHNRALALQMGVDRLPTAVILTPRGQIVDRQAGYVERTQFAARLAQVAAVVHRQSSPEPPSISQPTPPPTITQPTAPPTISQSMPPPTIRQPEPPPFAPPALPQPGAPPAGPAGLAPPAAPFVAATPASGAPLGLDGYCPVELVERKTWVLGDRQWGALHEGRTYLFAGPGQQQRFLADPARYSPVFSGNDVVVQLEQGQVIAGQRRHGVFFGDRIYLFASEESLQAFAKQPNRYEDALRRAEQARRPGGYR